jgi:hypothetical protein
MRGIDQLIVILWFLPVIFLIVLPLFVACVGVLYALFDVFSQLPDKSVNLSGKDHEPDPTHFHTATQPAPRAWPAPNPQSS